MRGFGNTLAIMALGLAADALAAAVAPAGCTNKCGTALKLAAGGKEDCSARLVQTVIPVVTTTVFHTLTHHDNSTYTLPVTGTTSVTVTDVVSETSFTTLTSTVSVEETSVTTNYYTARQTVSITTLVPHPLPSDPGNKKRGEEVSGCLAPVELPKPEYASDCDYLAYTKACSCLGVSPTVVTKEAIRSTVERTVSAYQTSVATITVSAGTNTETDTETSTNSATVTDTSVITATGTTTIEETISTTTTEIVIATSTLPPAPPTCNGLKSLGGTGFKLWVDAPGTTVDGWGVGGITIIGSTITSTWRLYSGGASQQDINSRGEIVGWWPSDLELVVRTGGPYQLLQTSFQSNIFYSFPTTSLSCKIGAGPSYSPECTIGSSSTKYAMAVCKDPVYYDWIVFLYSSLSELPAWQCQSGHGLIKARCVG